MLSLLKRHLVRHQQRLALAHAGVLLLLIGVAHLLPAPLSRGVGLLAAFLQMYWPLVAHEKRTMSCSDALFTRLYVRQGGREIFTAALCLILTLPPWAFLASLVGEHRDLATSTQALTWSGVASAANMCLVAAQEEWFWRGYLQPSLGGDARAIGVTSLLFGACHWAYAGSPIALATAIPSVVFGLLAARRGRLLGATCVHIGYNLASQVWLGL